MFLLCVFSVSCLLHSDRDNDLIYKFAHFRPLFSVTFGAQRFWGLFSGPLFMVRYSTPEENTVKKDNNLMLYEDAPFLIFFNILKKEFC